MWGVIVWGAMASHTTDFGAEPRGSGLGATAWGATAWGATASNANDLGAETTAFGPVGAKYPENKYGTLTAKQGGKYTITMFAVGFWHCGNDW